MLWNCHALFLYRHDEIEIMNHSRRLQTVAHTGFSYGVGTVSSPGPYPEKAPPLFLFSSNLRYLHYFSKPYFDHVLHP